jgi:hypothetical protein
MHEYVIERTDPYPDGRDQQQVLSPTAPRRHWRQSEHIDGTAAEALSAFFLARKGGFQPFYFYPDPEDWDETGASVTGRYIARFDGRMEATHEVGRHHVTFALREVY